jgi:hypothetical protein
LNCNSFDWQKEEEEDVYRSFRVVDTYGSSLNESAQNCNSSVIGVKGKSAPNSPFFGRVSMRTLSSDVRLERDSALCRLSSLSLSLLAPIEVCRATVFPSLSLTFTNLDSSPKRKFVCRQLHPKHTEEPEDDEAEKRAESRVSGRR